MPKLKSEHSGNKEAWTNSERMFSREIVAYLINLWMHARWAQSQWTAQRYMQRFNNIFMRFRWTLKTVRISLINAECKCNENKPRNGAISKRSTAVTFATDWIQWKMASLKITIYSAKMRCVCLSCDSVREYSHCWLPSIEIWYFHSALKQPRKIYASCKHIKSEMFEADKNICFFL